MSIRERYYGSAIYPTLVHPSDRPLFPKELSEKFSSSFVCLCLVTGVLFFLFAFVYIPFVSKGTLLKSNLKKKRTQQHGY